MNPAPKLSAGPFPSVGLSDPVFTFQAPPPAPGTITVTATATITGIIPQNYMPEVMCPAGGVSNASYNVATAALTFTIPYGSPAINHSAVLMLFVTEGQDAAGNAISVEIPSPP